MGSDVWLASTTGLIGVALGGLVSLAVSRQQIREARRQRADEAAQERYRRSVDRRFNAYSEFINRHRAVQNAVRAYYSRADNKPGPDEIDALLRSARDSVAMVFLVAEAGRTYNACRSVLGALRQVHSIICENDWNSYDSPWPKLNEEMGRTMREFQNAARAELEVNGPEWQWVATSVDGSSSTERPDLEGSPLDQS